MGTLTLAAAVATLRAAGAWQRGLPVVPGTNNALLTKPSKMPGYSWSLPAGNPRNGQPDGVCPGAVFGAGAICSGCYANPESTKVSKHGKATRRGGSYGYPAVRTAQLARKEWTFRCLMSKEGREEWQTVMIAAITWATRTRSDQARATWAQGIAGAICLPDYAQPPAAKSADSRRIPYFRVHDSGDMFSPAYADMWHAVCADLADVHFWIPTRSWHGTPRILRQLVVLNELPLVAVRPSALHLEEDAPRVPGLAAGTGAKSEGYNCPSSRQHGRCGSCRACWSKRGDKYYKIH